MTLAVPVTDDVAAAVRHVREGRVVAFPTGTSYGLAVDCLQGWALQRLRNLKRRPAEKTFTVMVDPQRWSEFFVLTDHERRILAAFAEQPLTLLVQPREALAHLAQDGRVGLRMLDHPLMRAFTVAAGVPLTATSANQSGASACYDPASVAAAFPWLLPDAFLNEAVPRGAHGTTYDLALAMILDGGVLPKQSATTIARLADDQVVIIRDGAVTKHQLEAVH